MWTRSLLFWSVVVAIGAGVWAGVNYAGTQAAPWIKGVLGTCLILAGAFVFLVPDPVDRRAAQMRGSGLALFGAAQLISSPWSLAASLAGLVCMVAAIVRRRRPRPAARPSV